MLPAFDHFLFIPAFIPLLLPPLLPLLPSHPLDFLHMPLQHFIYTLKKRCVHAIDVKVIGVEFNPEVVLSENSSGVKIFPGVKRSQELEKNQFCFLDEVEFYFKYKKNFLLIRKLMIRRIYQFMEKSEEYWKQIFVIKIFLQTESV